MELQKVKSERETVKRVEMEMKSQVEAIKFDNEILQKRQESGSKDKVDATSREDSLLK